MCRAIVRTKAAAPKRRTAEPKPARKLEFSKDGVESTGVNDDCAGLEIFGFQVPMTILNSHFSNLNSGKSIRKLLEIQISLGSEYLVQY